MLSPVPACRVGRGVATSDIPSPARSRLVENRLNPGSLWLWESEETLRRDARSAAGTVR